MQTDQRWDIIGVDYTLRSTSVYDYFHALSILLMRTIREEPQNISTYDIQGLGLQHIVSKESYGLYPPIAVKSIRNLSSIENRDYNIRLRILDWDL